MLVMYTMYQSISEALVKTAYLKMIDYWLLFCLLMPFVIFLIEIYWLLLKRAKNIQEITKGWITIRNIIACKRKIVRNSTYISSAFFVGVYGIIAVLMHFEYV
jgi:hypothetical protein